MSFDLTWYGHNTWVLQTETHRVVVDPFFDENPASPVKAAEIDADFLLISHGHFDHISDAVPIAKRTGAMCVAIFEIAQWLQEKHGVEKAMGMNIGGRTALGFGSVMLTQAIHSSQLPDGSYGGEPAGLLVEIGGKKIYFAADTALFSDMKLIGAKGIDLAVVPIGDMFTMGVEDSIQAIQWINPGKVLPCHYNTWPPIEQDAIAWSELVKSGTNAEPVVLQPGETFQFG